MVGRRFIRHFEPLAVKIFGHYIGQDEEYHRTFRAGPGLSHTFYHSVTAQSRNPQSQRSMALFETGVSRTPGSG